MVLSEPRESAGEVALMTGRGTPPLVSTAWLAQHLGDSHLKIIDASYFVAGGVEKALHLHSQGHIPGALFFNINAIANPSSAKDHAFPSAAVFAGEAGKLGLSNDDHIIAYDRAGGAAAAARAWFMFRAFGHEKVSLLDGGQEKWEAENRAVTRDTPPPPPRTFVAREPVNRLFIKQDILANISTPRFQVLDARSKGRFEGTEPEPRAGLRSGHIPGSHNLPFAALIDAERKTWKDPTAIAAAFSAAGIDLRKPLTTTCGSGVTACALAFGAFLTGKTDTALYDGSWVEWGADAALPLQTKL